MMLVFPVWADEWGHRAYGTAAIAILNFAVAFVFGMVDPAIPIFKPSPTLDQLVQHFGVFTPHAWITSAFVHGNIAHLAGNMMFLLTFGSIVEGHLGWKRFVPLYFAIAIVDGALEQFVYFSMEGSRSFGASSCIFALVVIAWMWAPQRRVTVFYWVYRYVGTREINAGSLAMWWVGWQVLYSFADQFGLSSWALHLLGAGVGFAFGLALLRLRLVETDGEDWFALRVAERERRKEEKPYEPPPVPPVDWWELLQSFKSYLLAVAAGTLIAGGLLTVQLVDWGANADAAFATTTLGLGMIGGGVWVFRYWQNR